MKAQSKMGPGEVGTAVLGRLGLCMLASAPPSPCSAFPYLLGVLLLSTSVSVFCLASPTVFYLAQALLDQSHNPVFCLA